MISGCSNRMATSVSRNGLPLAASPLVEQVGREKYLAVIHSISVETDEDGVKPLFEKILDVCANENAVECTLMQSILSTGLSPSANIKIRIKKEGLKKIISAAASAGKILEQTTNVDDLALPIIENNKRVDMLREYQARLFKLENRQNNDVDSLMKLSKELASTQSELEHATGENAKLLERVNLDVLNISISPSENNLFWKKIKESALAFSGNLSNGISGTITGLAYILPWMVVAFVFLFFGKKFWQKKRQ
jgi:hypothetical protein